MSCQRFEQAKKKQKDNMHAKGEEDEPAVHTVEIKNERPLSPAKKG